MGTAPAMSMSPAHAVLYREWRARIEEFRRYYLPHVPDSALTEERDEVMDAGMRAVDEIGYLILELPARTWGDVVLIAQVLFWAHWIGEDPEGPEVQSCMADGLESTGGLCDDATVKLIEAIFTVGGGVTARCGG